MSVPEMVKVIGACLDRDWGSENTQLMLHSSWKYGSNCDVMVSCVLVRGRRFKERLARRTCLWSGTVDSCLLAKLLLLT